MNSRQTVTFLKRRFAEVGIRPATRHGQNFLVDLNLVQLLVSSANLDRQDVVLEVGTGTGSLTSLIAREAGEVVTVEIDEHLHLLAREELDGATNVTMLHRDALKNKNHFDPVVLETLAEKLAAQPGRRLKLVSNLPYNIATPIISNLLSTEITPASMTVTIQKELADRIIAPPRTKDYSSLSVWMQSLCECSIVRVMPPTVFWPRPKVDSAIIHIVPSDEKRRRFADLEFFHHFVRSIFIHRRKFLRSCVLSAYKKRIDKPAVDGIFAQMELAPDARAEQLSVEQMRELSMRIAETLGDQK